MAFGYVMLVWIGAALMTVALLPERRLGLAVRLVAALLVGQLAGFVVSTATAPQTLTAALPDIVIGLALAAWIVWRPSTAALVVVIAFEAISVAAAAVLLLGTTRVTTPVMLASLAWRVAIAVLATVALVRGRRTVEEPLA